MICDTQVEGVACGYRQVPNLKVWEDGRVTETSRIVFGPLHGRYAPDDLPHLTQELRALPVRWRKRVLKRYSDLQESEGRFSANRWIAALADEARSFPIRLGADTEEIRQKAERMAGLCRMATHQPGGLGLSWATAWCTQMGIDPPNAETEEGALKRLQSAKWWRRQLLSSHIRRIDRYAREYGLVSRRASIYVSDAALELVQERQRNARALLEHWEATNELGDTYTLAELQELTVSNPTLRRNELMTRLSGLETRAREAGHVAMLITITCPSRFHAAHSHSGEPNARFANLSPRDGADYLNRVWANARRWFKDQGVDIYGVRVREPQQDGTPHDHLLVFAAPENEETVLHALKTWAYRDSPNEPGAAKHRFDVQRIDSAKGTATGYIAKYVSKNVDGHGVDADLYGHDAKASAQRVRAWASTWGIRQFQFFGAAPVCLWRELRRAAGTGVPSAIAAAALAADSGHWADFEEAYRLQPLALLYEWDDRPGEYGEARGYVVIGVATADGTASVRTRVHEWSIRRRAYFYPASGEAGGRPWSSVNNCTKYLSRVRVLKLWEEQITRDLGLMAPLKNEAATRTRTCSSKCCHCQLK